MALHYAILANGIEMLLLLASLLMLLWSTSYLLQFINLQIYTYREGHHGSPLADQCTPRLWFMNTFRSNHSATTLVHEYISLEPFCRTGKRWNHTHGATFAHTALHLAHP